MLTKLSLTFLLVYSALPQIWAIKAESLSHSSYTRATTQVSNTHFFIMTMPNPHIETMKQHLSKFSASLSDFHSHSVEFYLCNPVEHRSYCSFEVELYLLINTVKIVYNGRSQDSDGYRLWATYRLEEAVHRQDTRDQLLGFVKGRNEVFCYADGHSKELSWKQHIFVAIAKKFHFLHFCYLDHSLALNLGLKEGHLAMIREDLSYRLDYWSNDLPDIHHSLPKIWENFLLNSLETAFRQGNKDKSHDFISFECDFSLSCETKLLKILDNESSWRTRHPDINFKIKLLPGTRGEIQIRKGVIYKYPLLRYGPMKVKKQIVHQQKTGAVLEKTHYISSIYLKSNVEVNGDVVEELLTQFQAGTLEFSNQESSIDIRNLDGAEAEGHRESKRQYERERKNINEANQRKEQL